VYLDLRGKKWREAGEHCIMRSFVTFILHQILCDQVEDNEMDGACSAHGRDEKCAQNFGRKTQKEETMRKA